MTTVGPRRNPNRYYTLPFVDDGAAACRNENPDLWYPESTEGRNSRRTRRALDLAAVAICHRCPIETACLQYALDTDQRHGTWGGLTEDERTQLTGKRSW